MGTSHSVCGRSVVPVGALPHRTHRRPPGFPARTWTGVARPPGTRQGGGVQQPVLRSATRAGDEVVLRPHRDADADALVRMYADEQVHRWLSGPPVPFLPEHATSWVVGAGRRVATEETGAEWTWMVDLDGEPAGQLGLRPRGDGAFDVGYVLGRDAWGRGAMSAALREAARWAFAPAADGGAGRRGAALAGAGRQLGLAPGGVGVRLPGRGPGARPAPPPRSAGRRLDRLAAPRRPAAPGGAVAGGPRARGGRPAAAPERAGRRRADHAGLRAPDHPVLAAGPARPVRPGRGPALPRDRAGGPRPSATACTGPSPTPTGPSTCWARWR